MLNGLACCWLIHEWNYAFIIDPPVRDEAPDEQGPAGPTSGE